MKRAILAVGSIFIGIGLGGLRSPCGCRRTGPFWTRFRQLSNWFATGDSSPGWRPWLRGGNSRKSASGWKWLPGRTRCAGHSLAKCRRYSRVHLDSHRNRVCGFSWFGLSLHPHSRLDHLNEVNSA